MSAVSWATTALPGHLRRPNLLSFLDALLLLIATSAHNGGMCQCISPYLCDTVLLHTTHGRLPTIDDASLMCATPIS